MVDPDERDATWSRMSTQQGSYMLIHNGGHSVPTDTESTERVFEFIVSATDRKQQALQLETTAIGIESTLIDPDALTIAAKYCIGPLMDTTVIKFNLMAKSNRDAQYLIAAIPVICNRIAERENEMSEILEVMILENSHKLALEPGFSEAVDQVDGFASNLFRRLGALSRYQKFCGRYGSAYVSRCALEGCKSTPFGSYSHECDLSGIRCDCKRGGEQPF